MSRLSSIASASLRAVLGNRCLNRAVLARDADTATTIQTTNAVDYSIGGVIYSKALFNNQSFAVTHGHDGRAVTAARPAYVQPAQTTVQYVVALDKAGAVAIVQGTYAGQEMRDDYDVAKVLVGDGDIPEEPAGYTAIGLVTVATAAATTFTPGTTALNASGVTATFADVTVLPV